MFLSKVRLCETLARKSAEHIRVCRLSSITSQQNDDQFNYIRNFDPSQYTAQYGVPQQVWVEQLNTVEEKRSRIKELHQDVFAVYPRIDLIHQNVQWQLNYNKVNYAHVKNVQEMIHRYGGGKKPWPQKGSGRARHGSKRSPQWVNGGKAHGPRGPQSNYFMLPFSMRVFGLTHTLTVKFIQDDVHVVKNLEIPTDEPAYLEDLVRSRGWAKSTLIVDAGDTFPRNITAATEELNHVNLMPVYGLNVLSMLKHQTLVLTEAAVDDLTRKLLFATNRTDGFDRRNINKNGPQQELNLKMEKHRPLV